MSKGTLAQAVAASACFPPLFGPMRMDRAAERFKGGRAPGVSADARRQILKDLRVTDGGVYDNMGLEPGWKSHRSAFRLEIASGQPWNECAFGMAGLAAAQNLSPMFPCCVVTCLPVLHPRAQYGRVRPTSTRTTA